MNGLDAMRWLGADPRTPADDVERLVMVALNNRVVKLLEKASANG
jgi:hypothetical protein